MPVSLDSSTSRVDVAVRGEACLGLGQGPKEVLEGLQECDVCQK